MNYWIAIFQKTSSKIPENLVAGFQVMRDEGLDIYFSRDNRFSQDQIFDCNEERMLVLDGVILNLGEMKMKCGVPDINGVVEACRRKQSVFFEEFIGPFCGFYYNKKTKEILAFGNQTGDAPLFYCSKEDTFIVSNDFNMIINALKRLNYEYHFDETAALYIMTFGYMIDNRTFVKEIKRLLPGKYLIYQNGYLSVKTYFKLSYESTELNLDEAVEKVDKAFRLAVKRCFDKDLEYGYRQHLVDMSGGLDSRMTNWVAKDLGYTDFFNISYSQSNTDEERIAGNVSNVLGNTVLHEQLDNALFLYDIDDIIDMEYGLAPYFGITGGNRLLQALDMTRFGLEHTGQLGDVIIGTYTTKRISLESHYKRYSNLLDVKIPSEITEKYKDMEEYIMNTRGFLGMLATHLIRRHYTYSVSPFLDIDFLSTCMSIPMSLKSNHKLYWAWIDKKYPEAGKLKSTRERPRNKFSSFMLRVERKLARETIKILYVVGLSKSRILSNDMNPFQYWFDTNPKLTVFLNSYYNEKRHLLDGYLHTREAFTKMINSSNIIDNLLALTVLATVKHYFEDDNVRKTEQ